MELSSFTTMDAAGDTGWGMSSHRLAPAVFYTRLARGAQRFFTLRLTVGISANVTGVAGIYAAFYIFDVNVRRSFLETFEVTVHLHHAFNVPLEP